MSDETSTVNRAVDAATDRVDGLDAIETRLAELDDVLEESIELIDAVEVGELLETLDADDVTDAVDPSAISDAIGEDGDVFDARELFEGVETTELRTLGSIRDIAGEVKELTDAIDQFREGDDDGGVLGDSGGETPGDDGGDDVSGGGSRDGGGDAGSPGAESSGDDGGFGEADLGGDGGGFDDLETEAYQIAIQQEALDGIEKLRYALLETHETFERIVEQNREYANNVDRTPSSRNPTAVSTMTVEREEIEAGGRYSTIPRQVRYSTAPGHARIYGQRFEGERNRRRNQGENGE